MKRYTSVSEAPRHSKSSIICHFRQGKTTPASQFLSMGPGLPGFPVPGIETNLRRFHTYLYPDPHHIKMRRYSFVSTWRQTAPWTACNARIRGDNWSSGIAKCME